MNLPRVAPTWMIAGLATVSCKERAETPAPSATHPVQGEKRDLRCAGFDVRDGAVPPAKMLRLLAAELGGSRLATAQDLRHVDELITLCDRSEQDLTARTVAFEKWAELRPKIDLALTTARLLLFDDPANDADAQGKELKTGTNR